MNIADALRENYLFRDLSESQQDNVIQIAETRTFDGGDVMVRQFDKDCDLFIVLAGGARIKSFSGETLAEVGPGSVVGEVSLVDDQPRSATVVAVGPTSVAILPSGPLNELMSRDAQLKAQFVANIARVLCQRLRLANIQLDAALAKSHPVRV